MYKFYNRVKILSYYLKTISLRIIKKFYFELIRFWVQYFIVKYLTQNRYQCILKIIKKTFQTCQKLTLEKAIFKT